MQGILYACELFFGLEKMYLPFKYASEDDREVKLKRQYLGSGMCDVM